MSDIFQVIDGHPGYSTDVPSALLHPFQNYKLRICMLFKEKSLPGFGGILNRQFPIPGKKIEIIKM